MDEVKDDIRAVAARREVEYVFNFAARPVIVDSLLPGRQ
jgi:hypothetical protein